MNEELKGDTLCPPDVMAITLPAPVEFPGMPLIPNDDCQAITGAGIGEGLVVSCVWVEGDGNGGCGVKCMQPPAEFAHCAMWLPTWHEWITAKIPRIDCKVVR